MKLSLVFLLIAAMAFTTVFAEHCGPCDNYNGHVSSYHGPRTCYCYSGETKETYPETCCRRSGSDDDY